MRTSGVEPGKFYSEYIHVPLTPSYYYTANKNLCNKVSTKPKNESSQQVDLGGTSRKQTWLSGTNHKETEDFLTIYSDQTWSRSLLIYIKRHELSKLVSRIVMWGISFDYTNERRRTCFPYIMGNVRLAARVRQLCVVHFGESPPLPKAK